MVQSRRSRTLTQEQIAQQIEEDQTFDTVVLQGNRKSHYSVVDLISQEDIERKRKIRAAGVTRQNNISGQMTVTGPKPVPQRTTIHQAKNLTRTRKADPVTSEDRAIYVNKSEKSDGFYRFLKFSTLGLVIMGALIIVCSFGAKDATAAYNQQVYGRWPVTHFDGQFGLPNESKDHPTHVIAINDNGTFVILVSSPYVKNVQKYTLPLYGFNKSDFAQLSEITVNGHKTLEIQIESNVWYMTSDGKELVPQQPTN